MQEVFFVLKKIFKTDSNTSSNFAFMALTERQVLPGQFLMVKSKLVKNRFFEKFGLVFVFLFFNFGMVKAPELPLEMVIKYYSSFRFHHDGFEHFNLSWVDFADNRDLCFEDATDADSNRSMYPKHPISAWLYDSPNIKIFFEYVSQKDYKPALYLQNGSYCSLVRDEETRSFINRLPYEEFDKLYEEGMALGAYFLSKVTSFLKNKGDDFRVKDKSYILNEIISEALKSEGFSFQDFINFIREKEFSYFISSCEDSERSKFKREEEREFSRLYLLRAKERENIRRKKEERKSLKHEELETRIQAKHEEDQAMRHIRDLRTLDEKAIQAREEERNKKVHKIKQKLQQLNFKDMMDRRYNGGILCGLGVVSVSVIAHFIFKGILKKHTLKRKKVLKYLKGLFFTGLGITAISFILKTQNAKLIETLAPILPSV